MEYLDLYDKNKKLTGEKVVRGKCNLKYQKIII